MLGDASLDRVISSPVRRCLETLAPLCRHHDIALEVDDRLREGESVGKLVEMMRELGAGHYVLCSHGDLIPGALRELEEDGLRIESDLRCDTAGVWRIEGTPPSRARYERAIPAPVRRKKRLAVLDLGSTSFHLLVADVDNRGGLVPVDRERIMLRLGSAIVSDGRIPDPVIKRVVRAANFLGNAARRAGAEVLLPIATSAVRDAENGMAVAKKIGKALGSPVDVLSGNDEARITFEALAARGALGPGRSLAVDLGGGSLELGLGDATELEWETTLRLGVARLGRELIHSDPPTAVEALRVADRVREELREASLRIRSSEPYHAVATGGTIRALGRRALTRREGKKKALAELRLDLAELREIRDELLAVPKAKRRELPGVQRRRADLLPAGCIILATLCEELDLREIAVSDWGLREGILLRNAPA